MYVDVKIGGQVAAIVRRQRPGAESRGSVPVSVLIGIAEGVRIVGKNEKTAEKAMLVRDATGAMWDIPLDDVCSDPFDYPSLLGGWIREQFAPAPKPEPEPAPKSIPIESNRAHGVDIPIRTEEAPDAPGIDQ